MCLGPWVVCLTGLGSVFIGLDWVGLGILEPLPNTAVEKHSRSSTPRPDHGAIRALRQSPRPEAPPVSEEHYRY